MLDEGSNSPEDARNFPRGGLSFSAMSFLQRVRGADQCERIMIEMFFGRCPSATGPRSSAHYKQPSILPTTAWQTPRVFLLTLAPKRDRSFDK